MDDEQQISGQNSPARAARRLRAIEAKIGRPLTALERMGIVPFAKKQRADWERTDYALMRGQKLPETHDIESAAAHIFREMMVPNADPSVENRIVVGPDNTRDLMRAIKARVDDLKPTSNGEPVRGIHFVCAAANRAWYDRMNRQKRRALEAWQRKVERWIEQQYGRDNVMSLVWHMDEETPHLHAIVLPLDFRPETRGRKPKEPREPVIKSFYNAKRWFGSPRDDKDGAQLELSKRQDEFWEAVKEFGLVRGQKGSKRGHTPPAKFEAAKTDLVAAAEQINALAPTLERYDETVADLKQREAGWAKRNIDLNVRIGDTNDREHHLNERERRLAAREANVGREIDARVAAALADADAEAERKIAEATAQVDRIREDARVAGEEAGRAAAAAERQRVLDAAHAEAEKIKARAKADGLKEIEAARQRLDADMATHAATVSDAAPLIAQAAEVAKDKAFVLDQLAQAEAVAEAVKALKAGEAALAEREQAHEASVSRAASTIAYAGSLETREAAVREQTAFASEFAPLFKDLRALKHQMAEPEVSLLTKVAPTVHAAVKRQRQIVREVDAAKLVPQPQGLSYAEQKRIAEKRRAARNAEFDARRRR